MGRAAGAGRPGFGDALFGDPPFYALSEAGLLAQSSAPGGGSSVRGIPGQRFAGKVKLVGIGELRAQFLRFNVGAQRFRFGAVAFAAAGRAWADFGVTRLGGRDVDGSWSRFTTGLGGGLRLAWGETLVIRMDQAWSPSEGTDGLYIDIGNAF